MSNLLIQEIYFLKQVKPYIMYLENNSLYTFYQIILSTELTSAAGVVAVDMVKFYYFINLKMWPLNSVSQKSENSADNLTD